MQPYLLSIPKSYDGTRPDPPLYLVARPEQRNLPNRISSAGAPGGVQKGTMAAGDLGQIQLEVFGRGNNAYHWAGEVDIFEGHRRGAEAFQDRSSAASSCAAIFSLGGARAWHLGPASSRSRWVAAEIGAGTWPRRYLMMDTFPTYQRPTLRIWENITEWALNGFNLPIAAHDGDSGDTQIASFRAARWHPDPWPTGIVDQSPRTVEPRKVSRRSANRWQRERPRARPTFLISEKTGHGVNADVHRRLNDFLKEWVTPGRRRPIISAF